MIKDVHYKVDIHTLHRVESDKEIGLNDIGKITVRTSQPLFIDSFSNNKNTGAVIIIDEFSHETVAVGMISQ